MSSSHSDDLQSLHGIASDSGYTSAASTTSHSRKRASSLTSLRSSRSTSTPSNPRTTSLNAKFDRLNSSMNDVATASATSAGAGTSLGVQRKTIAQAGEGARGSVQGSASARRSGFTEDELEAESWRDEKANERERRKRRRRNEAISGPGSSLGAVGEAFRLLSWEGRRGSREDDEARPAGVADQHDYVQLARVPSPSGSGRVRTVARDAGMGSTSTSRRDRSPPPMALPPWTDQEKPATPPRTYSPPPEWLARIMGPPAPRHSPPRLLPPHRAQYTTSQPTHFTPDHDSHLFPSATPLDSHFAHSQPAPYPQQTTLSPAPFSTRSRMEFSFSRRDSNYGPPSQQPLYEAQLAREGSAMDQWRDEGAPMASTTRWEVESEGGGLRSGGWGSEEHLGPPREQHFDRAPSPPRPFPPPPLTFESHRNDEQEVQMLANTAYHPQRPSPASQAFDYPDYPSITALLRANGWQSPPQPFEHSLADQARSSDPRTASSELHEEGNGSFGGFWKRAPRPARLDDGQSLHRSPSRDLYTESLLQSATAPEIEMLAPRFPSLPQEPSPRFEKLSQPAVAPPSRSHLLNQPTSTPLKQQPIVDHPPPLSRKSSSSAPRAPLLAISQPRPQKQATAPLASTINPQQTPSLPFPTRKPNPPPPTRQRSFPRPDPVFRPSTAPNPPTSPLVHGDEGEEHHEMRSKEQLGQTSNDPPRNALAVPAAEAAPSQPHPAPDASPLRAPSTFASEITTQEAASGHFDGEEREADEDDFESRSTDGDSIFPAASAGTTMTTRFEEEEEGRELSPLLEEEGEEEQKGGLLAGASFSIFEDPEDPIQRFTQD
ncbi:hypothetical protein BCR35DRAFT_351313 [Leucosporidium creatinivorum]|uniref:Uncharacterized protein n=1 Tax=Leucosporidium creatinivorum TaxID=106004 RepID=A0A1Y2FTU6_9BASI|nr:hypothetical protein BCR35DRAFT_351313 [Leucosporidium creatinivorum]